MSRLAFLVPFIVIAACGGSEPGAKQPVATTDDSSAICAQSFVRQRECTDVFIPALVAARVKHDVPPGIAASDAKDGRDALVAQAKEEWKADSTDDAIGKTCEHIGADMPPEHRAAMTAQVKQCLAAEGCPAFVDCMIPVIETHLH